MTKETTLYREGCDDAAEAEAKAEEQVEDEGGADAEAAPVAEIPVTAFLVVVHEVGRVDAIVGLPEAIARQRDANLRDVRDACSALRDDALVTMISGGTAETVSRQMAEASKAMMVQRMRQNMGMRPQ